MNIIYKTVVKTDGWGNYKVEIKLDGKYYWTEFSNLEVKNGNRKSS